MKGKPCCYANMGNHPCDCDNAKTERQLKDAVEFIQTIKAGWRVAIMTIGSEDL